MYKTRPLTLVIVTAFFVMAVVISLMASRYTTQSATPGGRHQKISITTS
jgi:preprotein translocase subunit SecG